MYYLLFLNKRVIISICLVVICIFGDYLVELSANYRHVKAICDNLTHGLIGFFTALIILTELTISPTLREQLILITACAVSSSLIDVDHFIAAKSWHLKVIPFFFQHLNINCNDTGCRFLFLCWFCFWQDATSLSKRPVLHCTTIPVVATCLFYLLKGLKNFRINLWLAIVICAFLTHHTRDAARRGYWIYPFGSTKPIPYVLYILCSVLIPFYFSHSLNVDIKLNQRENRTIFTV